MKKRAQAFLEGPTKASRVAALARVPREVFAVLDAAGIPLSAYQLLWRLQNKRARAAPPTTIYRAMSVLINAGLAHRIIGTGAYVSCRGPEHRHEPAFLVCDRCGAATEIDAAPTHRAVRAHLPPERFNARQLSFLIRGVCRKCATSSIAEQ